MIRHRTAERAYPVEKTEQEWRAELTPERFHILREAGTERPGSGAYVHSKVDGLYHCAACGAALFASDSKFDSGTGWPSFTAPVTPEAVHLVDDSSFGMRRTEVRCGQCGSHLGHVFPDGPGPTGARYCMNSLSLDLEPSESGEETGQACEV